MNLPILAITLDLDDTLWPFAPIGDRIEQTLHAWMCQHSPATAAMFPAEAMRDLREQAWLAHPHLHHDFSELRRIALRRALQESGADPALLEPAFAAFYAVRNQVQCYPDALDALARIAARVPVAALSNGNADLQMIGIDHHFVFQLGAREHGAAKPDPTIFHAACARLGVAPAQVLHVGDHMDMDVAGAIDAGLKGCWINREAASWSHPTLQPDLQFDTLTGLADWLDERAAATAQRSF